MRQLTFFLGLVFNLVLTTGAAAQGSWQPAGATADFPRTLLKASDLAAVRASLDAPATYSLFSSLYGSAFLQLGTANSTSGQRHDRSNLAKNAAFVLLLDRKPAGGSTAQLDPAERDTLQNRARRLLETSNTVVEPFATWTNFTSYDEWQWRSKELIDYLIAYDLLRGAGVPAATLAVAQARLQLFAGNLYQQSMTSFLGISFYSQVKNNHTLMTAAALGMAAVVLNDVGSASAYQQPSKWISAGLYNIDNVLWQDSQRQSDAGAVTGYAEGPYYFKYAFLNCLPFFRAMGNFLPDSSLSYTFGSSTRSIRNPYYDPRYDLLYDWVTAIRLPDGRLPALEDSYVDMAMPELALTGKRRYLKPLYLSRLAPGQLGSLAAQLSGTTVDMRAAYRPQQPRPDGPARQRQPHLPRGQRLAGLLPARVRQGRPGPPQRRRAQPRRRQQLPAARQRPAAGPGCRLPELQPPQ